MGKITIQHNEDNQRIRAGCWGHSERGLQTQSQGSAKTFWRKRSLTWNMQRMNQKSGGKNDEGGAWREFPEESTDWPMREREQGPAQNCSCGLQGELRGEAAQLTGIFQATVTWLHPLKGLTERRNGPSVIQSLRSRCSPKFSLLNKSHFPLYENQVTFDWGFTVLPLLYPPPPKTKPSTDLWNLNS